MENKLNKDDIEYIAKKLKQKTTLGEKQELLQKILIEDYDMKFRESIDAMLYLAQIGIYEM